MDLVRRRSVNYGRQTSPTNGKGDGARRTVHGLLPSVRTHGIGSKSPTLRDSPENEAAFQQKCLQDNFMFEHCSVLMVRQLVEDSQVEEFEQGETIFSEGSFAEDMYVVVSGAANIFKGPADKEWLATLRLGSVFGEMAVFGLSTRTTSVIAAADCECLKISHSGFYGALAKFPRDQPFFAEYAESRGGALDLAKLSELQAAGRDSSANSPVPARSGRDCVMTSDLFAHRNPDFLQNLIVFLNAEEFETGDVIIKEGEMGYKMYLVGRGRLEVLTGHEERQRQVDILQSGDLFGEMTLFGMPTRTATIRALGPVCLYACDQQRFNVLLQKFPQERRYFSRVAQQRMEQFKLALETPEDQADAESVELAATAKEEGKADCRLSNLGRRKLRLPADTRQFAEKKAGMPPVSRSMCPDSCASWKKGDGVRVALGNVAGPLLGRGRASLPYVDWRYVSSAKWSPY